MASYPCLSCTLVSHLCACMSAAIIIMYLCVDVHTVSPSTGSSTGGALLTITGLGFAETSEDVIVDVGGVPCEVVSVNTTVITCWTGVPSPGSEVIASEEGGTVTFTGVESGLRFEGELLLTLSLYAFMSCDLRH